LKTITSENGRVGIVVPHGVLFRSSSEGTIRQKLISENLIDAVIGLPGQLFYGTGIPTAILLCKRGRISSDVLFIDASREYKAGTNQNILTREHIDKITTTYRNKKTIEKYSYLATQREIEENNYNLNIPRYVDTFEDEEPVDILSIQKEIEDIEGELSSLKAKMSRYLKELGF
jgi:type I restriction enzyme M protein